MELQDRDAEGASFYPVHCPRKTMSWLYKSGSVNAYKILDL
jgi:hypothetical protein